MTNLLKKAGLGVALAATAITTMAAPAEAQRYRGGYRHHGGNEAGAAIVGGLAGLAIGAAIASNGRDRYYRDPYYNGGGYDRRSYNSYYSQPQYRPYYPQYREQRRCWIERRWDPYYGQPTAVRVCR